MQNGNQLKQILHFKGKITEHRVTLLPGNYKVIFRALATKDYLHTKEKSFTIKSGKSELIKIY